MEGPVSLEYEKKLLLENYSEDELCLFDFLVNFSNSHFGCEAASYAILTEEDGSNNG